ncbi:MAG: flagellar basal body P-ring formation chaperone FlgA [Alphaproteobacteria bacterium]|nr:flagellar basal body P-ring formation chaperone FlgA [Alphaproteobacteria bacterium]
MKKSVRVLFACWLVLSGIAGSPSPCVANTAVTLKPDLETDRRAVRLSDLFAGVPSEIDRDIAQAPPPCKPAVYNEIVLDKLAETYRLDWQAQGTDHVTVSSACARVTADMIRTAVIAKIKTDASDKKLNFDIAFDTRDLEIDLPTDKLPNFRLENFAYDPTARQFRADFTAETPLGPYVVPLTGRVSVKRTVPVLAHRLEAGETVALSDLDWIEVPDERITADVITETNQLVGREVRRDIAEGSILRAHDVIPQRLVQRGSLVTMKIETPFISISAQGKAQQDGALGDTVRVVNTQSNRIVEGVVTGPGTIEIRTTRKLALAE